MSSPTAPPRPTPAPPPPPSKTAPAKMAMPTRSKSGSRVVFVAVNGYGKTTCGAYGPEPVVIMSPDEHGYITLHDHGIVPSVPIMQPKSWPELLASIESFAADRQGRKTIVLDALAGLEFLLARHVCETRFKGDWGKTGFLSWNEGPREVARIWPSLLARLMACSKNGMNILILGHAKVSRFNNPDGADYDRYECNCGAIELWNRTRDWAEAVLFGNFRAIVDQAREQANIAKAHGKAIGQQRIIRCQYSAAADAKNQYGLGPEYVMPDDREKFAESFWSMVSNKETAR